MSKDQKNKLCHHHIISMVLTLTDQSSHVGELIGPTLVSSRALILILGQASLSLLYGITPGSSQPIGMQGIVQLL